MAAYDLLSSQKSPKESFSKVIHRKLAPEKTAENLLSALPHLILEKETLGKMDEVVSARKNSMAASPVIDHQN